MEHQQAGDALANSPVVIPAEAGIRRLLPARSPVFQKGKPGSCAPTRPGFRCAKTGLLLLLAAGSVHAAKVGEVLQENGQWLQAQRDSQQRVDAIEGERGAAQEEYRTVLREIEGLDAYNAQLDRQLALQRAELGELEQSIAQATVVDRQILPLMLRMVGALDQFVALDLPFLAGERTQRIAFIREAIDRVDVTVAEKFRQVLEAYQVELEFGRTIEAYTGIEKIGGQTLEVDFLRVGRIGLYYQTLDGRRSGRWEAASKSWVELSAAERNPLREAIRVARKLVAPNLLSLPLPTPGAKS